MFEKPLRIPKKYIFFFFFFFFASEEKVAQKRREKLSLNFQRNNKNSNFRERFQFKDKLTTDHR